MQKTLQAAIEAIITTGYRTLAKQYHPDVGGDAVMMQMLNVAMEHLQELVQDPPVLEATTVVELLNEYAQFGKFRSRLVRFAPVQIVHQSAKAVLVAFSGLECSQYWFPFSQMDRARCTETEIYVSKWIAEQGGFL